MIDKTNDFFKIVDHYKKTAHVVSIPIFEAKLSFVPDVTIAIPTYKRAKLLKEAVDSAINQLDYTNYDIIVVDNNPERHDETEKMMTLYEDTMVSYYKNTENIAIGGNWNRLYTLAKGKYVVMLHDDDLLFPDYLSAVFRMINQSNVKYGAYFPQYVIHDMRKKATLPVQIKKKLKFIEIKMRDIVYSDILGAPTGMCMEKQIALNIGGFNSVYISADYEFYVRIIHSCKVCKISGYPLLVYRIGVNDSAKTETLLTLVNSDISIRRGILADKSSVVRKLFESYMKVNAHFYLKAGQKIYSNYTFDVSNELNRMGLSFGLWDVFLYLLVKSWKILTLKKIKYRQY
jgi:glycosyltransferase involved in cell wall biosynthesis